MAMYYMEIEPQVHSSEKNDFLLFCLVDLLYCSHFHQYLLHNREIQLLFKNYCSQFKIKNLLKSFSLFKNNLFGNLLCLTKILNYFVIVGSL